MGLDFLFIGADKIVLGLSFLHVFKDMSKNSVRYKFQNRTQLKRSATQESRTLFKNSY
jgi:hypothetical protein